MIELTNSQQDSYWICIKNNIDIIIYYTYIPASEQ